MTNMSSILKIVIGALLLGAGLYLIFYRTWEEFYFVLKGLIPPIIAFLGFLIVWIEMDELKMKKK